MNIDKLIEIAEWLEAGAPHYKGVDGFDMQHFIQTEPSCGTTCCIAGAAVQFSLEKPVEDALDLVSHKSEVEDMAADILGIDSLVSGDLFYGEFDADPAWAARCIRNLIATGTVDWFGTEHT